jgi:hypothetical protein
MVLGKLLISITRLSDGKTAVFSDDFSVHDNTNDDWSDWEHTAVFMWEDGNYSCNCNRFLFFNRALGLSEAEIDAIDPDKDGVLSCGAYEKFRVDWIKNEAGEIIYREDYDQPVEQLQLDSKGNG